MDSKLLAIIATGDKEKALAGLMFTRNAIKYRWLDDVKVVFFGPSEELVVHDERVAHMTEEIAAMTDCFACKYISDEQGVSEDLVEIGIRVKYVGTVISDLIKEGYVPMVW
jgi:hypothetical protein